MSTISIAFIGGGNMANAIIGGLRRTATSGDDIVVLEPNASQRDQLQKEWGVHVLALPGDDLSKVSTVVWAVKPQHFTEAAQAVSAYTKGALHFSVMAGIRTADMARILGTERIVRCMPNTPALIGLGTAGLYARASITEPERATAQALMAPTGRCLWVDQESDLDSVTALSGSGPAYVFYFIEAMIEAAQQMGLSAEQGRELALGTFAGATELTNRLGEAPQTLRERVTSKGGTTFAAISAMDATHIKQHFIDAMQAARERAIELGDEFGQSGSNV